MESAFPIIASVISGLALAVATGAARFAFSVAQRITRAESNNERNKEKIDFIYERIRWSIVTDIKSNPHPDDQRLEELAEKFLHKSIGRKDLRTLVQILESRIKEHPIEKEQMKAQSLLELIKWEYQLGERLVTALDEGDKGLGRSIHGLSRRIGH